MRIPRWLLALGAFLLGRRQRSENGEAEKSRIVPEGAPERGAENVVLLLLVMATLLALGFILVYAEFSPSGLPNELLGILLGLCFACIAGALGVLGKRLVVSEELDEDYPPEEHPEAQATVAQIVEESGSKITRKRLLMSAGAAAGGTLGAAAVIPALSLGPLWDSQPLYQSPWRRGLRLVDVDGKPYGASDIEEETFYTAFPQGADTELIGSPVVIVRLNPDDLRLPASRQTWAPQGILAYSKICTHAGCAIGLYRKPTFPAVEPRAALVCPCHYSTFDPARGGTVIYGPAGRPLPQLPLMIGGFGALRAAGNYSGPVGPSWWGVRSGRAR